jgi:hypothetical protein
MGGCRGLASEGQQQKKLVLPYVQKGPLFHQKKSTKDSTHLLLSEPSHNYKCTVRGVTYKILEPDDDINRARK